MWIRILTAAVALAVFVPLLLFAPNWAILCVFGLLAAVAAYEIASCVGLKKEYPLTFGSMLLACLSVAANMTWVYPITDPLGTVGDRILLLTVLYTCATVLLFLLYIAYAVLRKEHVPAEKLGLQGFFLLYVTYAFRSLGTLLAAQTSVWLWITLCIPWVADSLAYFAGRAFGKHKLCPGISPKKTVEGAIGGVLGTGIIAVVAYGLCYAWEPVRLLIVFGVSMLLAVVSVFGDLFASVVKRRFDVKDYGKLFPGHGGVLDRFDSILPVAIVANALLGIPQIMELL